MSLTAAACTRDGSRVLTADLPLHLQDHLDAAEITGSDLPATIPPSVEWRFDEPQPGWKPTAMWNPPYDAAVLAPTGDAWRVTITERMRNPAGFLAAGIHVDVPDWRVREWAEVVIRARADTTSSVANIRLAFNLREGRGTASDTQPPFLFTGPRSPVVRDGRIHTYRLRLDASALTVPWQQLVLWFITDGKPGSIDILSVSATPMAALYADDRVGSRSIAAEDAYRRSIFTHAPGRLEYQVRVPEGGRLHTSLVVLDRPVEFRVTAQPANGETTTVFHETYADLDTWGDRAVDLSSFAGQTITLGLDTRADETGTVAFWGSPTISGTRVSDQPNVIFYIIDGGGADYMSVYGYNRRTTPNLEKLAAEGAVFEHVYSNSSWTKPSTASFMTSLHNSVLGNTARSPSDPLSPDAMTMAEHFSRAGYQTAVLTSNGNAGTVSGLERGADLLREAEFLADAISSVELHKTFWNWRERSPGQPYWVHFQTTDVHAVGSNRLEVRADVPVPPFGGLFVSPGDESRLREWSRRVLAGGERITSEAFKTGGVSRVEFLTLYQGMYDQQMAHNDHQLGRLVDQLKASGEWQNTVLIVAADHSIVSALTDTAVGRLDPLPAGWPPSGDRPIFRPTIGRVPLIVVWPGHIAGGQRFGDAVSMIDVLPTLLDLAALPAPEVMQGQSLAPLLLGRAGWQPRPVIFDEFQKDPRTDQLSGLLEVVDGRWGASLAIGPRPDDLNEPRPPPLLLYDLWTDPLCVDPVNEAHPELVKKYTAFLEEQWKAHQALATQFTPGEKVALTPGQLERLRSLGYIR